MNQTPDTLNIDSKKRTPGAIFLQVILILLVLTGAVSLSMYFIRTGPTPKARTKKVHPPLVMVQPVHIESREVVVEAMGTTIAAKEVTLTSGISGEIVHISAPLIPGTLFTAKDDIISIDPIDYQLEVLQKRQALQQARNDLKLEMGNQRVALREFELLGQDVSEDEKNLMLRKPQLEQKQLAVKSAEAKLAKAELDLSRTTVSVPFNSVLLEASVDLGSRVTATTPLVKLAPTDEILFKLTVPVEKLDWLQFPDKTSQRSGSKVKLILQNNGHSSREGQLLRLGAELEPRGRLAQVYGRLDDPFCLQPENRGKPRILLGSYVKALITGKEMAQVAVISRNYLHEDSTVRLLGPDNTLLIRKVKILWASRDELFISAGLQEGDLLITTPLATAVPGQQLRIVKETTKAETPGEEKRP